MQSSLGEPLRAEIEVTSLTNEEAAGLQVRIAGPDAYRTAGVEYNPILSSARAALQRRSDGRTVLRLLSDRVVQEPFVELILDLAWPSGRLVREYTLLIDPPASRAPVANVETLPAVVAESGPPPRVPAAAVAPPPVSVAPRRPSAPSPARPAVEPDPGPATEPAAAARRYRVRPGDTLLGIAERERPSGVSLDQMLASLYRGNRAAFIGNNIDRLRSGALLTLPSAQEALALSPQQARQTIQAQSADFGAYRRGLAAAAVESRTESASRQASGTLQAAVEDRKSTAATSPDRLTLSKDASTVASVNDALASLQRERRDAEARLAALMRSIDELKALAGQTAPAASAPTVSAAPAAAAGPAAAPPVGGETPGVAPRVVAVPASAPQAASAAPTSAAPSASPVAAARAPVQAPVEPATDRGFVASLIEDNSFALLIGAMLLSLLLVAGVVRYRRRAGAVAGETSFLDSGLKADSFFAGGSQQVDTREPAGGSLSSGYSLSQLDAGGDVDPVAEADVYLAYGRDLQAEEILKDAMRSDPERLAIRTKLLEVYAKRRDAKGFEVLASQLHSLTAGEGEDWEKAQEMGKALESDNPLYAPGGAPQRADGEAEREVEPLNVHTRPQAELPPRIEPPDFDPTAPVDIDLGFDDVAPGVAAGDLPPLAFDEAGAEATEVLPVDIMARPASAGRPGAAPPVEREEPNASLDLESAGVDFGLPDLPTSAAAPAADAPAQSKSLDFPMEFDLSRISLDLDLPAAPAPAPASLPIVDDGPIDFFPAVEGDPLQRKLTLAQELLQLGDSEGARDLLLELREQAEGPLKAQAEDLLARAG